MGFDKEFNVGEMLFICNIKSKGPRIYPYGVPCFIVPQFEKKVMSRI
jgi:hypothetical protein